MSDKKITFVGEVFIRHPVPSALKQLMNESGYRIIDAVHAPKGAKTYDPDELLDAAADADGIDIPGEEPGELTLKSMAERLATKREHLSVTYFGDTQLNLLVDTIRAGKLLRVNKVTVAGEEVFGYEDDQGVVLDGYFRDEAEAQQILEDTVAEHGSDDTLALYGMPPNEPAQRQPIVGDPGVGTGNGTTTTPAGGAPGNGANGGQTTTVTVPDNWKDSEWHEKIALAKQVSGKDKIEAADGKTATQVAEEIIQAYVDGKK